MKRATVIISAAVIIAVAVAALFITQKPVEVSLVFPEMEADKRDFILPLVNGFQQKTGASVTYSYENIAKIYSDLEKGSPSSDLYYMIRNFQSEELSRQVLIQSVEMKEPEGVPGLFTDNALFIPLSWYPWGVYYNKEKFRDLGLEKPETWEDFKELCNSILAKGYTPLSLMTKIKWPSTIWFDYMDIMINGEEFHKELLAGRIPFTDHRVVKVFREIAGLHREGYIRMDSESRDWTNSLSAMEEGDVLMHLSGTFFYETAGADLKEKLGWFPFPGTKTLVASSSGFVFPSAGRNKRGALAFLEYALSVEGQKIMQEKSGLIGINSQASSALAREDIELAVSSLNGYDSMIPSMERNTHEKLLIPLKSAINSLYALENDDQFIEVLTGLEEYRLSSIK